MTPGARGILAVLSDGRPRTAVEIFRAVHESRIAAAGLKADLGEAPGQRLRPLVEAGLLEAVNDRRNSFFLTGKGHAVLRDALREATEGFPRLVDALVAAIEREIGDARQARMFAESRLANIWELAAGMQEDPRRAGRAALLRLAIVARLESLLARPTGTGHDFMKEVHDQVTDYYYSQLMSLASDDTTLRGIDVSALAYDEVAPGLAHAALHTRSRNGPLFLNVLRVQAPRRLRVEDVSARPREERFITRIAERTGALAVVSAGYFIYSEKGYEPPTQQFDPVALCLVDGALRQPPVFRRGSALVGSDGSVRFRRVGLADLAIRLGPVELAIEKVNVPAGGAGLVAYNNVWGREVAAEGGVLLTVVNGRVVSRGADAARIPLNGFVLRAPSHLDLPGAGELLPLHLAGDAAAVHGVAAGPLLLRDGRFAMSYDAEDFQEGTPPVTFSGDRTIDRNLIPRCGIGTAVDGTTFLAIVDGRQPHLSVGATLVEFAGLLSDLGATEALNLDGGGTAAMQVGDRVVSNPSTSVRLDARGRAEAARTNAEKNVRPLATALLVV